MDAINRLIETGLFEDAVKRANAELQIYPRSARILRSRSVAYARLGQPQKALADAEEAVRVCDSSDELPYIQLRRAIALYGCKRVGEAKSAVQFAADSWPSTAASKEKMLLDMWQAKISQSTEDAVEIPRIPPYPDAQVSSHEPVPAGLNLANSLGTSTNSSTTNKLPTATPSLANATENQALTANPPSSSVLTAPRAPRYDWFQSDSSVGVSIFQRGLSADAKVDIHEKVVQIGAPELEYALWLADSIDPAESSYEITPYKLELHLKKKVNGRWQSLEPVNELSSTLKDTATGPPPDTTRIKPTPARQPLSFEKKWDIADESDDDDGTPQALFRKIYEDADPETRRAMAKSFTESNGTALSTNWSEVSKGPVETHLPDDFKAKRN